MLMKLFQITKNKLEQFSNHSECAHLFTFMLDALFENILAHKVTCPDASSADHSTEPGFQASLAVKDVTLQHLTHTLSLCSYIDLASGYLPKR